MVPASPQPLLFLVTGARGVGKTTFCAHMARAAASAGWQVAGLLSHPVFEGSLRVQIVAEDLRSGERRKLAERSSSPTPGTQLWQFDPQAMSWGNHVLQASSPCDLLIIDELGPLEFRHGTGWQAGLDAVDRKAFMVGFVVIRAELLGEALLRWDVANLIEIETPEDGVSKARRLAEQLF